MTNDYTIMQHTEIFIKGANGNNLKNVDLAIPKNQLVVVTGVSGSGKSSITMDTLFAEGQRRYVESLSSYARQFLMRMKKPDVDYIKGVCPAIAIEQKTTTRNARSTVGSLTEIYDYLRLLYARVGRTYSPVSGELVRRRVYIDKKLTRVEDVLEGDLVDIKKTVGDYADADIRILIDRFVVKKGDEENIKRIGDSVQVGFYESEGEAIVQIMDKEELAFNNRFELDGILFLDPTPHLFNYNNPFGACPKCEGYGKTMGIDEAKVVPLPAKSVYEEAIACWKGEKSKLWLEKFLDVAHLFEFPVHTPRHQCLFCRTRRKDL